MSKGVLLVNLGSPDSPSIPDVRRYLNEFLMDGRVLDTPWPLRRVIVAMIMIRRAKTTAHAYRSIWTDEGSPLIVISKRVQRQLQELVTVPVELAMRYQKPSIKDAVRSLAKRGITELLLIPLFPHYAMSSYETAVERVKAVAASLAPKMQVHPQPPFYNHPGYIAALVASADEYLRQGADHLLFSFHGIPERHVKKADLSGKHCLAHADCCDGSHPAHATCYRAQCFKTMSAFTNESVALRTKYSIAFQSRLGRDPWLKPYSDFEIERLAAQGVKRLAVICPAFVSDCLETVEEIGIRGREAFLKAGGTELIRIPCMNEHRRWLVTLEEMVGNFVLADKKTG